MTAGGAVAERPVGGPLSRCESAGGRRVGRGRGGGPARLPTRPRRERSRRERAPPRACAESETEWCVVAGVLQSKCVVRGGGAEAAPRRWNSEDHQHQQRLSPSSEASAASASRQRSPSQQQLRDAAMATTRGPNVSILHLRNAADPWDCPSPQQQQQKQGPPPQDSAPPPPPASFARTTPRSSGSASATANSGGGGGGVSAQLKPTYSTLPRRESSLLSGVTAVSTTVTVANSSGSCSRELSPVRWCDREVDGVYLGRSGWVQVQQRSLDESRRAGYGAGLPPVPAAATTVAAVPAVATLPRRPTVRLADYHCNSEPGKCPVRPAYLPLAAGFQPPAPPSPPSPPPHRQDGVGPSLPMSPPSITPIISPPPAFQDTTQRYQTAPRLRSGGGGSSKTPFLPRSNALVVENEMASPPPSPPPPQLPLPLPSGWSTLPAGVGLRARRLTPSPVGTPAGAGAAAARLPQTKSLEDTSASAAAGGLQRRSQFHQKRDSSSTSSSSSFGFRSLDSCAGALGGARAMPRLSETDSSVGGYEDGDELDDRRDSSLNLSSFSSSVTVVNSSPETPAQGARQHRRWQWGLHRGRLRAGQRTAHAAAAAVGDQGLSQGQVPQPPLAPAAQVPRFGRQQEAAGVQRLLVVLLVEQQQQQQQLRRRRGRRRRRAPGTVSAHVYHTWDGRNRVRRSRSLQLPETKSPSPGHAGPQPPPPGSQPGTVNTTPPAPTPEYQYFLVKNYRDKPSTTQYYHQATSDQHRVLVKLPQESSRRQYMQHTRKAQSEDCRYDDWEAVAEEARAVTEYLYGTRSRAAARALLAQRYHSSDQSEEPARRKDNGRPFNVFVVRKSNPHNHHDGSHLHHHQQVPAPPPQYVQRPRRSLQRGVTTPTSAADANPCNPDTCDFWPHCAHRDSLYPPTKSSTPSPSSSAAKLPPSAGGNGGLSMRASQSYPSSSASSAASRSRNGAGRRAHHDAPDEKAASAGSAPSASRRSNGSGARSSPPSLDRLEEYDALTRKIQSVLDGAAAATAALAADAGDDLKRFGKWRASNGLDKQQLRRSALLGERPKTVDAVGPPTPPQHSPQQQQKALKALRGNGGLSLDLDALPLEHHQRGSTKTSPVSVPGASRSPSNKGGGESSSSSASSSSSDVWVTTSDRTVTKSPRTHKSSGASTPLGSAGSGSAGSRGRFLGSGSAGSGSAEREAPVSRPGSAPTQDDDGGPQRALDAQQRSLSLPKSFLSERYGLKPAKHR
ncbi:LOW QUALITY PROTEIN: uncharacterized protein LOC126152249 [Schistocerca cancellata]|uniref:LOW QUALITY PROTEIN: uncharacterized protein LOC126152249 n=1 Tax=Schistocerca cancellata TaxID=274614 RepID=UPI0021173145|nr:LOW QUALITY PROTEIN: uncharacterized protein LOC126152249 [Schistocerca cancellata]